MQYDRFIELITKKKLKQISLPEQKELRNILESDPEYRIIAENIEASFEQHLSAGAADNRVWKKIESKINDNQGKKPVAKPLVRIGKWQRWLVAASLITVAVLLFQPFVEKADKGTGKPNVVITQKGSKSQLTLPDGTKVWLNADSRIVYNNYFERDKREVTLIGEAFFDVVKDNDRPFTIHTKTVDIRVLGTAFNVRAYPEENLTQTALIRGSVEVIVKNKSHKKIVLKPTEKLIVSNPAESESTAMANAGTGQAIIASVQKGRDAEIIETSWMRNKLAFHNEKLGNISLLLERWYNVSISIKDEALKEKEYSATFENESIEQAMEALSLTGGFRYSINKNEIIIQ